MTAKPRSHRLFAALAAAGIWSAASAVAIPTEDTLLATSGTFEITPNNLVLDDLGLQLSVTGSTNFGSDALLALTVVDDHPYRLLGTKIPVAAVLTLKGDHAQVQIKGFEIRSVEPGIGYDYLLVDAQTGQAAFEITSGAFLYDPASGVLTISTAWLRVTDQLAAQLQSPRAAGNFVAAANLTAQMSVASRQPFGGPFAGGLPGDTQGPGPRAGGDVVYTGVSDISNHGTIGGFMSFSLGTQTCNIGNQNIAWTSDGTPGVGFNAFRLNNGRLTQVGMGWVKTACCAAAGGGCGLTCNGQGGSVLGAGCMDVYGAGYNAIQGNLMSRSQINPWTGSFGVIPAGSGDTLWRRCQVATADLQPTTALYFVEGVYVGTQDCTFNNRNNNASYRRATTNGSSYLLVGSTIQYAPAILAWRANGLGAGVVDNRVIDGVVDVPNEGRFHTAHKVTDNQDGTWTYDFAIYNLTSHLSGGSFEVPVPSGVTVSNVGFNGVRYHSGDLYDNTAWPSQVGGGVVRWQSPQTFAQNANSNALRWGTMYNFWFTANRPPAGANVTLGLFRPNTPQSVAFTASAPSAPPTRPEDLNGDGVVDLDDLAMLLSGFGCNTPPCVGDIDGDGDTDVDDLARLLSQFGT